MSQSTHLPVERVQWCNTAFGVFHSSVEAAAFIAFLICFNQGGPWHGPLVASCVRPEINTICQLRHHSRSIQVNRPAIRKELFYAPLALCLSHALVSCTGFCDRCTG